MGGHAALHLSLGYVPPLRRGFVHGAWACRKRSLKASEARRALCGSGNMHLCARHGRPDGRNADSAKSYLLGKAFDHGYFCPEAGEALFTASAVGDCADG